MFEIEIVRAAPMPLILCVGQLPVNKIVFVLDFVGAKPQAAAPTLSIRKGLQWIAILERAGRSPVPACSAREESPGTVGQGGG